MHTKAIKSEMRKEMEPLMERKARVGISIFADKEKKAGNILLIKCGALISFSPPNIFLKISRNVLRSQKNLEYKINHFKWLAEGCKNLKGKRKNFFTAATTDDFFFASSQSI